MDGRAEAGCEKAQKTDRSEETTSDKLEARSE
jgi:hypothetical protein